MFVLGRPVTGDLERLLSEQASERVTYGEVGATRGSLPEGYRHDRHVIELGEAVQVAARHAQLDLTGDR